MNSVDEFHILFNIPGQSTSAVCSVISCYVLMAQSMDLNTDVTQRDIQSTYDVFSSAGEATTTPVGAHSMAQPVMATQALMPGLFAFPSLTPGSTVQPHSMSYVLPSSSQLLSDCATSTLAGAVSSGVNNSFQSTVTPVVQSGMAGMTRMPASVSGASVQPSASTYSHSNRVSYFIAGTVSVSFYRRCTSYGNSVCLSVPLSVCHTPVLCQNDST